MNRHCKCGSSNNPRVERVGDLGLAVCGHCGVILGVWDDEKLDEIKRLIERLGKNTSEHGA